MALFGVKASVAVFRTIGLLSQADRSTRSNSIYGFSVDHVIITTIEHLLSLIASIAYYSQKVAKVQYANRYPLYPQIHISQIIILTDLFNIITCIYLLYTHLRLRHTRHEFQEISTVLKFFIGVGFFILVFLLWNCRWGNEPGRYGIFYLDFVNWLWVLSNVAGAFKSIPQASLNYIGLHSCHITNLSFLIELARTLIFLGCGFSENSEDFHYKPLNIQSTISNLFQLLLAALLVYQSHSYRNEPKRLRSIERLKDLERDD